MVRSSPGVQPLGWAASLDRPDDGRGAGGGAGGAGAFAIGSGAVRILSMSSSAPATSASTKALPFSRVASVGSPPTPEAENVPGASFWRVIGPDPAPYSRTALLMSTAAGST